MAIVIIGDGLAGASAAIALREAGFGGEVIVLGDEPGPPIIRPPLSKTYLRGEEDESALEVKPASWYEAHDVELRDGSRVRRVDPGRKTVTLADGTAVAYDRLLIASGCRARRPSMPGIDLEGVFCLRTRADGDAIRARAAPGQHAVIAGMSFIGAEVAASLRQLGLGITAVFPDAVPLERILGETAGARVGGIHADNGVRLLARDRVVAFHGSDAVEAATAESGGRIDCAMAVLGLGVEPNVEFLEGSGIAIDDGVVVDPACRTNVEDVFAAGDVARHDHPLFGRIRIEHYNNAEKQGRHAALSMLGDTRPYEYVHTFWSDQYEHTLEYVGFAKSWDQFVTRGAGEFLGFYLKDGMLLAAMGLDRGGDPEAEPDSELAACVELIRERRLIDPATLADEGADLHGV